MGEPFSDFIERVKEILLKKKNLQKIDQSVPTVINVYEVLTAVH
jgi:hypothetical protein